MRESYVEALNKCKMLCFDGSSNRYSVTKYFECMATKTLALADTPMDAEDLHFKPDYNYVEINKDNFRDKILYYMDNEKERKRITENAYTDILKYHTLDIRVKQLLKYIEELF